MAVSVDASTLRSLLEKALRSPEPIDGFYGVTDELTESGAGVECVRVLLEFMENHPKSEFGVPGPLVHFVETFQHAGYEAELLTSLRRQPTAHTVWMANRVLNVESRPLERAKLLDALKSVARHPSADQELRAHAAEFLRVQAERRNGPSEP